MRTRTRAIDLRLSAGGMEPPMARSWQPFEKRDKTVLFTTILTIKRKETKDISRFQRVLDMSFGKNNNMLVLSVMNNGQSDIYTYFINNARVEQITNDYYDDLSPRYIKTDNGYEGILFASTRMTNDWKNRNIDSILPVGNNDLYFYKYDKKSKDLVQVTHTRNISETAPIAFNDTYFAFLSDYNGIRNRFAGYLDTIYDHTNTILYLSDSVVVNPTWDISEVYKREDFDSLKYVEIFRDAAYTFPVTNYNTNILSHDISLRTGKLLEVFQNQAGTSSILPGFRHP